MESDPSSRPVPSDVNLPLTPTPDGVGEPKQIPRNSRAHGTSPRQLAAQEKSKQRDRNRVAEFEGLARKHEATGRSLDAVMDQIDEKKPTPEEREAAIKSFKDARASGTHTTED